MEPWTENDRWTGSDRRVEVDASRTILPEADMLDWEAAFEPVSERMLVLVLAADGRRGTGESSVFVPAAPAGNTRGVKPSSVDGVEAPPAGEAG